MHLYGIAVTRSRNAIVFCKRLVLLASHRVVLHPAQRLMWLTSSTNVCGYSISFSEPASTCMLPFEWACIFLPQAIEVAMSGYGLKIRKLQRRITTGGSELAKQIEFRIWG